MSTGRTGRGRSAPWTSPDPGPRRKVRQWDARGRPSAKMRRTPAAGGGCRWCHRHTTGCPARSNIHIEAWGSIYHSFSSFSSVSGFSGNGTKNSNSTNSSAECAGGEACRSLPSYFVVVPGCQSVAVATPGHGGGHSVANPRKELRPLLPLIVLKVVLAVLVVISRGRSLRERVGGRLRGREVEGMSSF